MPKPSDNKKLAQPSASYDKYENDCPVISEDDLKKAYGEDFELFAGILKPAKDAPGDRRKPLRKARP